MINTTNLCFSTKYIVEKAEPSTFRYLGNGYGTDGNELFLNGEIIEGNNGEDFLNQHIKLIHSNCYL